MHKKQFIEKIHEINAVKRNYGMRVRKKIEDESRQDKEDNSL